MTRPGCLWRQNSRKSEEGFTVFELLLVLVVVAILVGLLAPAAFQAIQSSKEETARRELERIFNAIVGDPDRGSFGYLGDMGRLPATLSELVVQGGQPAFHTADGGTPHVGNVGTGWRGPYVTGPFATADLFKDAWGQPLVYTSGQIISTGLDGTQGTGDDIVFPVQLPVLTTGTLLVTVIVNDIPQPTGVTVKVYSTSNGEQGTPVTRSTPTPSDGKPFRFDNVPHGISVLEASHTASGTTVTRILTVPITAGTQMSRQVILKTSATVAM